MLVVASTILGGVIGEGCGCDEGKPYVDGKGQLACNECTQYAYDCVNQAPVCAANELDAIEMGCEGSDQFKDCRDTPGGDITGSSNGCGSWEPDSYVTYITSSGRYEIEQRLVTDLENDPSLIFCDSAYYVPQPGGYYTIDFIETDDLAYHLGFRNGDRVLAVNGHRVQWPRDYAEAFEKLDDETELMVTVFRNSTTLYLYYRIVE